MSDTRVLSVGGSQAFRQQVARAVELPLESVEWVGSVTAAEEELSNGAARADVLVVAPAVKEPDAFGLAEFVSTNAPATAVVLVRDRPLDGLLATAVRAGMRDVVDLSRGGQELKDALDRAVAWSTNLRAIGVGEGPAGEAARHGTVISVFSSKGGTGKTFLATNLAAAISTLTGEDTAVLDLDLRMGDVFSYFGQESHRAIGDLVQLGEDPDPDGVREIGTRLHDHLWGFGASPDPSAEPVPGEAVGKILRALRGTFAYTVVDSPADYSDHALVAFDLSDQICLITALDVVGARHLAGAMETLVSIGVPKDRFRFVLNRADSKVGLEAHEVEKVMNLTADAMIPSSRLVPTSLNKGRSLYLTDPGSTVGKAIAELARKLLGTDAEQPAHRRRLLRRG